MKTHETLENLEVLQAIDRGDTFEDLPRGWQRAAESLRRRALVRYQHFAEDPDHTGLCAECGGAVEGHALPEPGGLELTPGGRAELQRLQLSTNTMPHEHDDEPEPAELARQSRELLRAVQPSVASPAVVADNTPQVALVDFTWDGRRCSARVRVHPPGDQFELLAVQLLDNDGDLLELLMDTDRLMLLLQESFAAGRVRRPARLTALGLCDLLTGLGGAW